MNNDRKVIVFSIMVASGVLLGRIMGFVREAVIAARYGVSVKADVAVLALTVPDVMVNILVAGGLSAALIPEFKNLSEKKSKVLFVQVSLVILLSFSLISLLIGFIPNVLVDVFAPGLHGQVNLLAQKILSKVIWVVPLTVLAGVSTSYLQSQEKFFMPAIGTFLFNSCIVLGLLFFVKANNLNDLVYFIFIGGAFRYASQLWVMRNSIGLSDCFTKPYIGKELLYRYVQAVLGVGVLSLFPVVARAFASFSGEGGVAMMNYAWRLVEFPLGVVITVLSVVLFPKLSEKYAKNDIEGFDRVLKEGLFWSLLMAMAIMGPIIASPETFVNVVYGWGDSIPAEKISAISMLLKTGIIILPFQAVIAMSVAAFNAQKNTKFPMQVGGIGFVLLVPVCWWAQESFGLLGIVSAVLIGYAGVSMSLLLAIRASCSKLSFFYLFTIPFVFFVSTFLISRFVMKLNFLEGLDIILLLIVMCVPLVMVLTKKLYFRV